MVTPTCEKCGRRNLVIFHVEPKEAWRTVMRDRWKSICPSCFDAEAELAPHPAARAFSSAPSSRTS
jgi:hypothetical protein